jgi:DNA-binding SARP family transcriptional activator
MDFRLLGTIEVSTDAGALALGGPRARAVLAALALNVGRAVPTDQLIEDLWGGLPPASAGHTLETYIYRLRRALETGRPHGARLATRPSGYMLDAAPDLVDVYRFRGLAAQGGEAVEQGDAAAAAALVASRTFVTRRHSPHSLRNSWTTSGWPHSTHSSRPDCGSANIVSSSRSSRNLRPARPTGSPSTRS